MLAVYNSVIQKNPPLFVFWDYCPYTNKGDLKIHLVLFFEKILTFRI